MDSTFANKAFAEQLGLSFPLLSDWGAKVTREFGVFNPKYEAARRVTYLIGTDGKIEYMQVDQDAIDPSKTVVACERTKLKG